MSKPGLSRVLPIDGALNFRDLGGYSTADGRQVKWGRVYRSAQLDRLTDLGIRELAELDVRSVIDLRFSNETQRFPTIRRAVPNADIYSWHDEKEPQGIERSDQIKRSWKQGLDSNDPLQVREAMRVNYPQKLYSHHTIYRRMLLCLSDGQTPLVFHCAAGKDRTGVAAALILSLLGVDNQQIEEDYLLTQNELQGRVESWFAGGATTENDYDDFQEQLSHHSNAMLEPLYAADLSYIRTLLDYVSEVYGSFSHYAQAKLDFDSTAIEKLKSELLE
jgi:protein-tyrosine phosphatase